MRSHHTLNSEGKEEVQPCKQDNRKTLSSRLLQNQGAGVASQEALGQQSRRTVWSKEWWMNMKIWVDDVRTPPDWSWAWYLTSDEAINALKWLKKMGDDIKIISLDHDLGGDDTTRPIVLWMIENDFWPVEVKVHSANPVGREWLEGMIERYKNG
jgi:hypothetical protein